MLTGQNFFISDYSYEGPEGTKGYVALGTDFPSKIVRLNVNEYGGKLVCQKGALLCASHTINIEMEFTKTFSGGFFGGEGFVLQALTGEGDVFLKAGGALVRRDLEPGEELRISSGALVGFSEGVNYGTTFGLSLLIYIQVLWLTQSLLLACFIPLICLSILFVCFADNVRCNNNLRQCLLDRMNSP